MHLVKNSGVKGLIHATILGFPKVLLTLYCTLLIVIDPSETAPLLFENVNPCLTARKSEACLSRIVKERLVSREQAISLRLRAEQLFGSEESHEGAIYGRLDVAVACLASKGTLLPGPDDDCASCGPACEAEALPQVCALYCTNA